MSRYVIMPTDYKSPIIAAPYCLGQMYYPSQSSAKLALDGNLTLTPYLKSKMSVVLIPDNQTNRWVRTQSPLQLYPKRMVVKVFRNPTRNTWLIETTRNIPDVTRVLELIRSYAPERSFIEGNPPDHIPSSFIGTISEYLPGAGYLLGESDYIFPTLYLCPATPQLLI